MSRSYRKFPSVRMMYDKQGKKYANRRVRKYKGEIPNGNAYRKLYEQWDIVEYRSTQFKEWEIRDWYKDQYDILNNVRSWKAQYNTSLEECLAMWKKWYYCK